MPQDDINTQTGAKQPEFLRRGGSDHERSTDKSTSVRDAERAYGKGTEPKKSSPVGLYLASRGLWPLLEVERHMIREQFYDTTQEVAATTTEGTAEGTFSGRWMAVPLYDENGSLSGVQRTSLTMDGKKVSVGGANDRLTIGDSYGNAVRIGMVPGDRLYVTEGTEDAMSVVRIFPGAVCWATAGRRGLEELVVPPSVTEVVIFADRDDDGISSAKILAQRQIAQGRHVRIVTSPMGKDANDLLRHRLANKLDIVHPIEEFSGWISRIEGYAGLLKSSAGEAEQKLKALAKSHEITASAAKSERSEFLKIIKPRRSLDTEGILATLEKAESIGYSYSKDGVRTNDIVNVQIALRRIGLTARRDTFDMSIYLDAVDEQSPVVAFPGAPLNGLGGTVKLTDELLAPIIMFVALRDQVTFSDGMLLSAISSLAHLNRHNSMQDWLNGVGEWDGIERLEHVLVKTFTVEDTPLNRWASASVYIGQALRILYPGAKADVMLVLVGKTGLRKSSFAKRVAARDASSFSDSPISLDNTREAIEKTHGKTVIEWAELESLGKSDWEAVKAFLTRTTDSGRLAYGRMNVEVPRTYISIGTVNHMDFIRSQVGSRRFLPVMLNTLGDFSFMDEHRSQLWAEAREKAKVIIEQGEPELAVPPGLWDEMARITEGHIKKNAHASLLEPFLENFPDAVIKTADVVRFLTGHGRQIADREVGEAMTSLGFIRPSNAFEFTTASRSRIWYRGEKPRKDNVMGRLLTLSRDFEMQRPEWVKDNMQSVMDASARDAASDKVVPMRPVTIIRRRR